MIDKLFLRTGKSFLLPCQEIRGTLIKSFTYKELNLRINIEELIQRIKLYAFYQMRTAFGCQIKRLLNKLSKINFPLITFGFFGRIDHISIDKRKMSVLTDLVINYKNKVHHSNSIDFQKCLILGRVYEV